MNCVVGQEEEVEEGCAVSDVRTVHVLHLFQTVHWVIGISDGSGRTFKTIGNEIVSTRAPGRNKSCVHLFDLQWLIYKDAVLFISCPVHLTILNNFFL